MGDESLPTMDDVVRTVERVLRKEGYTPLALALGGTWERTRKAAPAPLEERVRELLTAWDAGDEIRFPEMMEVIRALLPSPPAPQAESDCPECEGQGDCDQDQFCGGTGKVPAPQAATQGEGERCPATHDGRLPHEEISQCEFCPSPTAFCRGDSDEVPPALMPRRCLRVLEDATESGLLCAEFYGEPVDDPRQVSCEKCRVLMPAAAPAGERGGT